eukprot:g12096.t1
MLSCLEGLEVGIKFGWFNFSTFDADEYEHFEKVMKRPGESVEEQIATVSVSISLHLLEVLVLVGTFDADEYEHFEKVECGDLNWVVGNKLMAFATPQNKAKDCDGYTCWTPETYLPLFKKWNVNLVVRLNKATCYDREKFIKNGVKHLDLYFNDGGLPPVEHIHQFLHAVENEQGAVAVHCKAGLGRTGTLIGAYVMKHYKIPAKVFIAWNRLVRPGSVLGPQQQFLCDIEASMLALPSTQVPQIFAPRSGPGAPIRVIANPLLGGSGIGGTPQKKNYAATASQSAGNGSSPFKQVEQQGQGEWLLSQKRRGQGMKTTYNAATPGAYTNVDK